jgi:DNA-binding transcriptional ArsR family regulator
MAFLSFDSPELDARLDALANSKRRAIIESLGYRPMSVGQLADEHGISLPDMHRQIKILEQAGLIIRKKAGRTNFVALNRQNMQQVQEWINQFRTEWGSDEATLENYIAYMTEELDED